MEGECQQSLLRARVVDNGLNIQERRWQQASSFEDPDPPGSLDDKEAVRAIPGVGDEDGLDQAAHRLPKNNISWIKDGWRASGRFPGTLEE